MYPDPGHDPADQTTPLVLSSLQHLTMGPFQKQTGDHRLRSDSGRNNFYNYCLVSPPQCRPPVDQKARAPNLGHYQGSLTRENTTYHRGQSDPDPSPFHYSTDYPDMSRYQPRLTNAMLNSLIYQDPSYPFQTLYCSRYPHPSASEQPDMGRSEPCYTQYRDLPSQCHPMRPAHSPKGTSRLASMVAENQPYQNDYRYPQHRPFNAMAEPVKYESYQRGAKRVKLMLSYNNCSLSSISGPPSNEGPTHSSQPEAKGPKHQEQIQPNLHRQTQRQAEPLTIESELSSCNKADCNPCPDVHPLAACQIPENPHQNPANLNPDQNVCANAVHNKPKPPDQSPAEYNPDHAVCAIATWNQKKPSDQSGADPVDNDPNPSVCTFTACVQLEPPGQNSADHNNDHSVCTFTAYVKPKPPNQNPADHDRDPSVCAFTACEKPKLPDQNPADHNRGPSICTFTACEKPKPQDQNSTDHDCDSSVCAFTACMKPKPPDPNSADHNRGPSVCAFIACEKPKPPDQNPADQNHDPYVCIFAACRKPPKPPDQYLADINPGPNVRTIVAYREQRPPDQIPIPPFWNYQPSDMMWLKRARYEHLQ